VDEQQTTWATLLPTTAFAYNNHIHSSTGFSPFFLNYSQHPQTPSVDVETSQNKDANEFAAEIQKNHRLAKSALEQTAEQMACNYLTTCN
jgi:uncharacterized protein YkwD